MARVSKQQADRNRQAVVEAASLCFRARGTEGVGLREVMAAAGLTPGAFARQFDSKAALAVEACGHAFDGAERTFRAVLDDGAPGPTRRLVDSYLRPSPAEQACPLTTFSIDVARTGAGDGLRVAFEQGFERLASLVAGEPADPDRLLLIAAMVGAAVLSQATGDTALTAKMRVATLALADRLDMGIGSAV